MNTPQAPSAVTGQRPSIVARPLIHDLAGRYRQVRAASEELCQGLHPEDYVIQSMPDASPAKWHLAHTSWFFETLVLAKAIPLYKPFHPQFNYLFNSYYLSLGQRHCRPRRGLISRPTVQEVYDYRRQIDRLMLELLDRSSNRVLSEYAAIVELGLHHEQQHQELLLTDIKHAFASNPLRPAYRSTPDPAAQLPAQSARWISFPEGLREIGHGGDGFAYDNESPRHRVFLNAFELASRPVANVEYRAFVDDGGYRRGELWLSDGWNAVQSQGWEAPLYWEKRDGQWSTMTLFGMRPVNDAEPVCHVSYFEADAFARWAGSRLPAEEEWEFASTSVPIEGNFVDARLFHPSPPTGGGGLSQMFGDVWQWTRSAYLPYPGYRQATGALGEYNGKFMCNQFVLRGGSCATPRSHIRRTYRNFFPPDARWQFTGFRLARDA